MVDRRNGGQPEQKLEAQLKQHALQIPREGQPSSSSSSAPPPTTSTPSFSSSQPSFPSEEIPPYPGPPTEGGYHYPGGYPEGPRLINVTLRSGSLELTARLRNDMTIREVKDIWPAYERLFSDSSVHEAMSVVCTADSFALTTNGVAELDETPISQISLIQSRGRDILLEVTRLDNPPGYVEDYTPDPGVGVTMKRFHPSQIQIVIASGPGYPMHVWPTSTMREVKACWARAAGVPASTITVVHDNQLVEDDETFSLMFAVILSRLPGRGLRSANGKLILSLEMPKRYAYIYPKPQFVM